MPALGDDRLLVRRLADDASKGYALQEGFLVAIFLLFGLFAVDACDYCAGYLLFPPGGVLPFTIKLPTLLVVFPAVEEFAVISKATETGLFVLKIVSIHNLRGKMINHLRLCKRLGRNPLSLWCGRWSASLPAPRLLLNWLRHFCFLWEQCDLLRRESGKDPVRMSLSTLVHLGSFSIA